MSSPRFASGSRGEPSRSSSPTSPNRQPADRDSGRTPGYAEEVTTVELAQPRIWPVAEHERSPRQQEVIADLVRGPAVNIYTTVAHRPELAAAMVNLGRTLRGDGISGRHREILILRTGWN